ncbi:hypothetical protein A464_1026 [Salmonella bongori N268-08]|uniref:Uncharacterized protein n=1 Tax=Salmonella bongori N268-08 TaxID=1197719 RepID=S5ND56_SALBN|nr:hypothetical protein A464_1026 [Salmonella bongori N268-08]
MNKSILSCLIGYVLDKKIVNSEMNNDRVKSANENQSHLEIQGKK